MKKLNIRALVVAILTMVLSLVFVAARGQLHPIPWSKTDSSPSATLTGIDAAKPIIWPKTDTPEGAVMTGYAASARLSDQNAAPVSKILAGTSGKPGAILIDDDNSNQEVLVGAPDATKPGDQIQVNDKTYEVKSIETSAILSPVL